MKKLIYIFSAMGIMLFSCNSTKEATKNTASINDNKTEKGMENSEVTEDSTVEEHDVFAYIKKTPCFGMCPTYEMTIFQDGTAVYEGIAHVDKIGKFKATFSKEEIENIKKMVDSINYFDFKEEYVAPHITDLPTTYTQMSYGGKSLKIKTYGEAPPSLMRFQSYLHQIMERTDWEESTE